MYGFWNQNHQNSLLLLKEKGIQQFQKGGKLKFSPYSKPVVLPCKAIPCRSIQTVYSMKMKLQRHQFFLRNKR